MIKNSVGILLVALVLLASCIDNNVFNSKSQFKKDTIAIVTYLKNNNISATNTHEGVWYSIDTMGLGIYPVLSDSVTIEYSIDSLGAAPPLTRLYSTSKPYVNLLSNVIAGLQIGLPRIPTGSYARLYIPSSLAFGNSGSALSNIKSNTNLLFTIKLVAAKGSHFSSDTAAVTKYLGTVAGTILADNGGKGKFVKDPSGIRYWYDTLYADSLHPNLTNHKTIELTYKAKVFNAVNYFQDYGRFPFRLDTAVAAWKIILPKISKGSKVQIFVPSGYGFGSNITKPPIPRDVSISIPANSNLVYEIELDSVY
jgi:FKBP-type peptidyl-prolyl cis-trans isomerase